MQVSRRLHHILGGMFDKISWVSWNLWDIGQGHPGSCKMVARITGTFGDWFQWSLQGLAFAARWQNYVGVDVMVKSLYGQVVVTHDTNRKSMRRCLQSNAASCNGDLNVSLGRLHQLQWWSQQSRYCHTNRKKVSLKTYTIFVQQSLCNFVKDVTKPNFDKFWHGCIKIAAPVKALCE